VKEKSWKYRDGKKRIEAKAPKFLTSQKAPNISVRKHKWSDSYCSERL